MHQSLAALLLVLLASHLAISISHVDASTEYPYTYTSPPPPPPPYNYPSPPPPPPFTYQSPPAAPPQPPRVSKPPPQPFKAAVTGIVYCDICKNGKLKKPLKGVTVGVFCWNGKWEDSFYATTNDKGVFQVELKGFDYVGCGGAKACAAKLISASYATPCTKPTNRHGGQKGARLHVKEKSEHGVTLKAGPFAYIPNFNYPKCYHHPKMSPMHGTLPPYKYTSPPLPPYKYASPPPPPQSSPLPPPCPPPAPTYKSESPPSPPY